MSSRGWKFRVNDILEAIAKVQRFSQGITLDQFEGDEILREAIIRKLEIIGEASRYIPQEIKALHAHIPWEDMNGMRNILIHKYFDVALDIVWHTVTNSLPILQKQLEEISLK